MTINIVVLRLLSFVLAFLALWFYATLMPGFPGTSDAGGWWGWYDQSVYLAQTNSMIKSGLEGVAKNNVYPPGYMLFPAYGYRALSFFTFAISPGVTILIFNAMLSAAALILLIWLVPLQRRCLYRWLLNR
jgi:hypothetical protein